MASTGIHFSGNEQPAARIVKLGAPEQSHITVTVDALTDVSLFMPFGPASVQAARTLAAVLLNAAEEHEAWMATAPAPLAENETVEPAPVTVPAEDDIAF